MKKIKFTLYLFITFFFLGKGIAQVSSENFKVIPAIIQLENNNRNSFTEYKVFNTLGRKNSSKKVSEVLTKASIFSSDRNGLTKVLADKPDRIQIIIPNAYGDSYDLQLIRVDIFSDDFAVKTNRQNGKKPEVSGVHYRGVILNNYESLVSMSFFEDEIMGFISSNDGQLVLGRLGKGGEEHILYHEKNLRISSDFSCSTSAESASYSIEDLAAPVTQRNTSGDCIDIYVEVDYDVFLNQGTNTTSYIEGLFNQSATLYANDGVTMVMSEMFIWESTSPYGGNCANEVLESFQDFRTDFNGDLGHLVSLAGSFGGIAAGLSGLCNPDKAESMCFSEVYDFFNEVPLYSWSVFVIVHEMGHLMGSRHTHACVWNGDNTQIDDCGGCQEVTILPPRPEGCNSSGFNCDACERASEPYPIIEGGTLMSYCHLAPSVGINFNNGFGPQPRNVILNNIINVNCLSCENCIPDLNLSGIIDADIYEVANTITSTGTIGNNQRVIYQAGDYILLEDVFVAAAGNGSFFLAEIEDCSSGLINGSPNILIEESTGVIYDYDINKQLTTDLPNALTIRNLPNPFTKQTTIEFDLQEDTEVTLFVSDITGKQIARLLDNKPRLKGTHQLVFDGSNYPAGMYYYTIQAGNEVVTQKMTLMK